jgi:hypothetical protein
MPVMQGHTLVAMQDEVIGHGEPCTVTVVAKWVDTPYMDLYQGL